MDHLTNNNHDDTTKLKHAKELIDRIGLHSCTKALLNQAKKNLLLYDKIQHKLIQHTKPIKEENNTFLSKYLKIKRQPKHNPNLIFKDDLTNYERKGYAVNDLNKIELFSANPLLDDQSSIAQASTIVQKTPRTFSKIRSHSEKVKKYMNKLDVIVIEKQLYNKGISKPRITQVIPRVIDHEEYDQVLNKKEEEKHTRNIHRENKALKKYNTSLAKLIHNESLMDSKPKLRKPDSFFNKRTISQSSRQGIQGKDSPKALIEYSRKGTEELASFTMKQSQFMEMNKKSYRHKSIIDVNNHMTLIHNNSPASVTHLTHRNSYTFASTINTHSRHIRTLSNALDYNLTNRTNNGNLAYNQTISTTDSPMCAKKSCLEMINKAESFHQAKKHISFYLKNYMGYGDNQITALLKNDDLYHDLLEIIIKLKKDTIAYDIQNKVPKRPKSSIKNILDEIEETIARFDRNYVKNIIISINRE